MRNEVKLFFFSLLLTPRSISFTAGKKGCSPPLLYDVPLFTVRRVISNKTSNLKNTTEVVRKCRNKVPKYGFALFFSHISKLMYEKRIVLCKIVLQLNIKYAVIVENSEIGVRSYFIHIFILEMLGVL